MSNDILNSLLKEYDQKKLKAEFECDERKNNLYRLIPRLQEIDNELNSFAFKTAKNILNNSLLSDNSNNSYTVENLEEKIKNLKKEKEKILNENNLTLDYLKPFYECNLCNDTGYVSNGGYSKTMCNCLKQKLLNYFKKLFLKIKDNYQICMNGFYNVDIYLDSIYGIILELKEEKLEFIEYYEDEIDMRISIHEDEFLYQIDDILKINRDNYDIYNYQNKWYIKLKNENKKNL